MGAGRLGKLSSHGCRRLGTAIVPADRKTDLAIRSSPEPPEVAVFVDAHTHLDHVLAEGSRTMRDAAPVVNAAREAGVTTIIQSGTDVGSSLWAVHAAAALPAVWATVGFHPHDASRAEEDALAAIAALTAHPRVVAVGEIGLDYHYDHSPREAQREAFVWLLELAHDASLPAVIHSREAEDDTLRLLAEHATGIDVVLHCFALPHRLAEVIERGYYISFAGNVTYKNAVALREAALARPRPPAVGRDRRPLPLADAAPRAPELAARRWSTPTTSWPSCAG